MASRDSINPQQARGTASSTVADDPAIAAMVRDGVLKARQKLIDLSMRNTMLNFRHSETSARHVRIVDEDLGFLAGSLSAGRPLDIHPLPPVEQVPQDEDTDAFRTALKQAKATDPEWLAAEDARRAAGYRRRIKDKVAERALRDRVRAQLGMSEWKPAVDPKARAKELGIDPSYDLQSRASGGSKQHSDAALQTLFFPDRLEPKLSSIYSAARALQEDAGLSALYCAAGFLEWYDPDDAPEATFAPLVLLPINMEKRIHQGEYVFSIAGRDDDEAVNVALRERLKSLGIDLPEYDAEGGIDAYLASVSAVTRNHPRWKVRRFATIGLFSFARQAMWSDLDPERWPSASRPEAHPLLGQIYGDVAGEVSDGIAPVHDVDHPELEKEAPALITNADASQLSAVIDVATGKNLVIQGPPGTGKSETITNVIANAMWHGKTILFVSEKMAALKVVKDRLDHFGVGDFCLEVHSAKASKTLVLKSIRERMQAPRRISNAQEVQRARDAFQQSRQRLTEYALLMNTQAGATGLTAHEVLWGDFTRGTPPEAVPAAAMEFRLQDPLTIDRFKRSELIAAGKALDELASSMGEQGKPAHQPWRGIGNLNLNRFDRVKAVELVGAWARTLERLLQIATEVSQRTDWEGLRSTKDTADAASCFANLPEPPPDLAEPLLPLALEDAARHSLSRWAALANEALRHDADVARLCSRSALERNPGAASALLTKARAANADSFTVDALEQQSTEAATRAESMAHVVRLITHLLQVAGRNATRAIDVRAEAMASGYLHAIRQIPEEGANYRAASLLRDGAGDDLSAAHLIATQAQAAASEAGFAEDPTMSFAASIPAPSELRRAADVFRGTGLFGRLFGSEWRQAKATWRKTFSARERIKLPEATRRLNAAAAWKDQLGLFENCQGAKAAAGPHWRGLQTPFGQLSAVAAWMKAVQRVTPPSEPGAWELRQLAFESGPDDFSTVLRFAEAAHSAHLIEIFQKAYSENSTIRAQADQEARHASDLATLLEEVRSFQLTPGTAIAALSNASASLANAIATRRRMDLERVATAALATLPMAGEEAKATAISRALQHADTVLMHKLPPAVARFLLQTGCAERTREAKRLAVELERALDVSRQAAHEAGALLELREDEWIDTPLSEAPLERLLQKCQVAAQQPDALDKQVQLLSTEVEASGLGLADLLRHWRTAGLAYSEVAWAVEAAFFRSAAEKLMRDHPVLARHAGNTHDQVRARFQKLDREILELNRKMVAAKLQTRTIPPGRRAASVRDYTDNEMLQHQVGLQQPRIALRRLFSNAGNAIRAYMPCIMMSPMSVAQYLEPGKHAFDLLVVDEASQMRPEDALGAMMRCGQAIIVGDPEQLPPTDFFTASDKNDGPDGDDAPEESILELGRRCWHPMRMLEVHYRSRHQSLIAYSNREFYDERLLVYPSPVLQSPDFGVSCVRVDGAYEVGQGRNPDEARAIVDEAAKLMSERIDRSIGIVAINQAQRDLIETLMDERAANDPGIQAYLQEWDGKLEDFFVKNLENVQGDERDIILISTVYGPTAEGVFHQHFGPLNRAYGHRRLNVLFTRAKRKLAVFTSLDHARIVADGNRRGVRVLKEFLEYASTGTVTPGRQTGAEPDSDFERWFLSRLKAQGYEAHPQVGVAKYRIDIGVVHPDKPGTYVLGVECDGATYHSSKSARDRDRLRQDVLEGLNWKIHRVWSTDWYRDPEREFARLTQAVERLRHVQ